MRPEDNQQSGRMGTPQIGGRSYIQTPPSRDPQYRQQEAAANIIRSQLDSIYAGDNASTSGQAKASQQGAITPSPVQADSQATQSRPQTNREAPQQSQDSYDVNPYERTHSTQAGTSIQADQWKQYHSAWQDYYKKYYERYYTEQVIKTAQVLQESTQTPKIQAIGSEQAIKESPEEKPQVITKKRAMEELKASLLSKVESSAKKVRKSRHFVPIISALAVLLIFCFLQYNQLIVANVKAYITPGNIKPQNIIVDPESTVNVGPDPRLIIPKINVDTPVFYDITPDQASLDKAMENGVAQFNIPGASSHPGEIGNTVLSGHSSNDVFAPGDYKYIFIQLDKLEVGDTIYANYKGKRYTYSVTKKEVVKPTEVNKLVYPTDKPVMTLITCTPIGTALNRLLVTAEQVYPDPSSASAAPEASSSGQSSSSIPGQGEPTLLERVFNR